MADLNQIKIIRRGVEEWNQWVEETIDALPEPKDDEPSDKYEFKPNLSYADLSDLNLQGINLSNAFLAHTNFQNSILDNANFEDANLLNANLSRAKLRKSNIVYGFLHDANFEDADLSDSRLLYINCWNAIFRGANFTESNLFQSDFYGADLSNANLTNCFLEGARFLETNLEGAILKGCHIHGIAAWDLNVANSNQMDLVITPENEPQITVDNIEVAQFVYLLLNNKSIRTVIDTITSKLVLILGCFTPARKVILDSIKSELRKNNYLPVLFDFYGPSSRDITETVSTLAHMARFVIADITDAKSIPQELQRIVPDLPSVPVVPILSSDDKEYGMFEHFKRYPWVLDTFVYTTSEGLLSEFKPNVIEKAEKVIRLT